MRIVMMFDFPALGERIREIEPEADILTLSPTDPMDRLGRVDVVLATPGGSQTLSRLLDYQPDVGWIHILGTGVDDYPVDLLRGRLVSCSKGATAVPIAEWVLAMMLAHAKRLPSSWAAAPPQQWFMADLDTLEGKTLGLIGFGQIGQAIARRALAFDMNVICHMRTHRPSGMSGVESVADLDEMIPLADHLVLALPSTAETVGLMNDELLSRLKPGSHLINISRAALIDHDALKERLDSGQIARASLDVVSPEPLPDGHWLYQHPSVQLSPHIAWNGPRSHERMSQAFLDNLRRWCAGDSLQGVVDTCAGY